ncbi:hypothetical protein M5Z40_10750, partial [Neisseria meningitidis]|nr:hypothetical protein [Neisseria meningitidis]
MQGLVATAQRQQYFSVGVEQARRGRTRTARVELRRGQHRQRLLQLPEIGARAGGDDAQLVGGVTAELDRLGPARQFDGPLRPAQTAFAIRDQRKQGGLAPHSSGCPQFGQR